MSFFRGKDFKLANFQAKVWKKLNDKKNKKFLIRLSAREAEIASYISEESGLSQAEIFRIGMLLIAKDEKPSENNKLKPFYKNLREIKYAEWKKKPNAQNTGKT